jgi:hypothetical protein
MSVTPNNGVRQSVYDEVEPYCPYCRIERSSGRAPHDGVRTDVFMDQEFRLKKASED